MMRTTHCWQVDTGADQQQEAPTLERRPYITRPAPEGGNSWKSQDQQSGPAPEEVENITRRAPDGGNSSGESGAGLKLFQTGEPAQLEHFIQRLENGDPSIFYEVEFCDSVLGTQQAVVRGEGTLHHKVNATMLDQLDVSQTRQPSAHRVCRATSL